LFGTAGRDAVKDFAATFKGGFDGPDGLHAALNDLGAEGERLWIKLTQGVGRNNPAQAKAVIEEITTALDAQKSKQAEVQAAAMQSSAAQIAAQESAKAAVQSLDNQIKTLSDSIAGEAPEEFMGIVEQQTRARIDGLTREREAAQQTLEDLTSHMTSSIDKVADAIDRLPKSIALELQISGRGVGAGESPEGFASGTPNLDFRSFGSRRRVDLHGDEAVIPKNGGGSQLAAQIAAALSGMIGGDTHVYIGNDQLDARTVKVVRKAAATGQFRTVAATGRSY
jgi:hypothetical protein